MTRLPLAAILLLALGACAIDGTAPPAGTTAVPAAAATTQAPATRGEIVLVEAVAPVSQRGGNAALQIGSSIVGAVVPGPWGGVAGVATGQVGGLALESAETRSARYHVRMSDGAIETFTQAAAPAMTVGLPVDVLTLADGSRRIIAAPLSPAAAI